MMGGFSYGLGRVDAGINRIRAMGVAASERAVLATAQLLAAELRQTLATPPSRSRFRRPSAQARRWLRSRNPRIKAKGRVARSGGDDFRFPVLRESIAFEIMDGGKRVRVGSSHPKAVWLEYGTQQTPARPFMRPTWQRVEAIVKSRGIAATLTRI